MIFLIAPETWAMLTKDSALGEAGISFVQLWHFLKQPIKTVGEGLSVSLSDSHKD